MGKLKDKMKQIRYYLCSASVIAGLSIGGAHLISKQGQTNIRCAVGDVGTGEAGEAKVAAKLKSEGCEEIVLLGDLIYDVGISSPDDPAFKRHFWNYYSQFKTLVLTQGNHDIYRGADGMNAWITLAARHASIIYPSHYFAFRSGNWCYFSFFSEPIERSEKSEFSRAQAEFAANVNLEGCKVKVAIAHHPMTSQGEHGDAKKSVRRFYEGYIIGKYDISLSGHDHNLSIEPTVKGTKFFVSGAGSKTRPCKKGDGKTCWSRLSFLKFTGDNTNPEIIFVDYRPIK